MISLPLESLALKARIAGMRFVAVAFEEAYLGARRTRVLQVAAAFVRLVAVAAAVLAGTMAVDLAVEALRGCWVIVYYLPLNHRIR